MNLDFLDFEQPIAELQAKIEELRLVGNDNEINIQEEIERLEGKSRSLTESIFSNLTPWQISQLARHPLRPYTLEYVSRIIDDFEELHGDRAFADDKAIVGGLGRIDGRPVMLIGHQKGRDTKEKIARNFGMPRPEGYRKALRLLNLAGRGVTADLVYRHDSGSASTSLTLADGELVDVRCDDAAAGSVRLLVAARDHGGDGVDGLEREVGVVGEVPSEVVGAELVLGIESVILEVLGPLGQQFPLGAGISGAGGGLAFTNH